MSYSNAAPSFGQAPEANGHGTDPVKVDPDRITIAVILARMTEFFDFFIYAIASALVFPHVFFSFVGPR